jgi:hypothetical protein
MPASTKKKIDELTYETTIPMHDRISDLLDELMDMMNAGELDARTDVVLDHLYDAQRSLRRARIESKNIADAS